MYGSNREGGGGGCRNRKFWGIDFLDPPRKFLGHFYENLNISAESSAQAQSIGTLFEQIELEGGGLCGHVQK